MFNPLDFLKVADQLKGGDEAYCRTSGSRSYYGCFLALRGKLNLDNMAMPQVHERLIRNLHRQGLYELARALFQLRKLRNKCDYQTNITISQEDADNALNLAYEIKGEIKRIWMN